MIDYDSRVSRARQRMTVCSHLLVTSPENLRYLTGYTGSYGAALVTPDSVYIATDKRYADSIPEMCPTSILVVSRDLHTDLINEAFRNSTLSESVIGFETDHLTVSAYDNLRRNFPNTTFTPKKHLIEQVRIQKDDYEVQQIRAACSISTKALTDLLPQIRVGMTEKLLVNTLERLMIDLGADAVGFDTIAATGPHSAVPHHSPGNRPIEKGDLIKIDFGARVNGYHADCTRTFVMGHAQAWQSEIHNAVFRAQRLGRQSLLGNPTIGDVDDVVRQSIAQSGFGEYFTHGLGHGVGLAIHELPFFSAQSQAKIDPQTVLTIEPGIYLPGRGGVRIEDTVLIGQHGYENLTDFDYNLIELGI